MNPLLIWRYGKIIGAFALVVAVVWYYKDAEKAKEDRDRVELNYSNHIKKDSVGFSQAVLTKEEVKTKVEYDPEMKRLLKQQNIKIKNLTQLITTQNEYIYQDTTKYVLNEILKGIREGKTVVQRVESSNDCHLVAANIHFNGKDLYMDSLDVKLRTRSDIIASLEKWRLKHLFKKRKVTVTTTNSCGESITELIRVER